PRADAGHAPVLRAAEALGGDRRRLSRRGAAAAPRPPGRGAGDAARLLPPGDHPDSPRTHRPGAPLLRTGRARPAPGLRAAARRARPPPPPPPLAAGGRRRAGRRLARPRPAVRLDRLPPAGRGPVRRRARGLFAHLVPGADAGRGGRGARRLRPDGAAPLAV